MQISDILNRPTLVLLIDCWHDTSHPDIHKTWQRIADVCYQDHNVQTVALASYCGYNYDVCKDEPWWSNSDELFCQTTKWSFLRDDWKRFNFYDSDTNPGPQRTSNIIKHMQIRPDQMQLSIFNTLQLTYYCNYVNPAIENIMIFGVAWEHCLQTRSVGWPEITYSAQYGMFQKSPNILTRRDCVLTRSSEHPEITAPWTKLQEPFYMLNSNQHCIDA